MLLGFHYCHCKFRSIKQSFILRYSQLLLIPFPAVAKGINMFSN